MAQTGHCPTCGADFAPGARFCVHDGTQLVERPPQKGPGRIVGERFVLKEMLGRGSLGVVYRAEHSTLSRSFIVKLLRRHHVEGERGLLHFFREAKRISAVHHPGILPLYDYGHTEEGEPYLVTEYVPGTTLHQALLEVPSGRLPLMQVVDIALQVAHALSHAHQHGVVHRDLKPKNVLLCAEGPRGDDVRVLDCGIATMLGLTPLSTCGKVLGTPEYLPPEAWMVGTRRDPAPAADLYALGILLHEALAGSPPFSGTPGQILLGHLNQTPPLLSQRLSDTSIPPDLDVLAAHLLSKDPTQRPDPGRVVDVLLRVQGGLPPSAVSGEQGDLPPAGFSLSVQQTMMVLPGEREQRRVELLSRATVLTSGARETLLSGRSGDPTCLLDRAGKETRIVRPEDRKQDLRDVPPGQVSAWLSEVAGELADEVWHGGWPTEAVELRSHIADCERACEELTLHIALLAERKETTEALARREGRVAPAEADQGSVAALLDQAQAHMGDLRKDISGTWQELARLLLDAPYPDPQEIQAERRYLVQLLDHFERNLEDPPHRIHP